MQIFALVQRYNRIGDDLPGAMVSDVTSAITGHPVDAFASPCCGVPEQVLGRAFTQSNGEDRFVLSEEERIANVTPTALGDLCLLLLQGIAVGSATPIHNSQHRINPFSGE
jgi:hypothetical protein